jgi:predicted amidophosphoribosyltransferase
MSDAAGDALNWADFIAATPMHWTRLAVPSFIQAAWLVQALLDARVVSPGPPGLARVKRRKSQAGLWASERRDVGGAIKARGRYSGKTRLLADEVFTTGAT